MITTTTPSIEGKQIEKYLGIVTGEAILGATASVDFRPRLCRALLAKRAKPATEAC